MVLVNSNLVGFKTGEDRGGSDGIGLTVYKIILYENDAFAAASVTGGRHT